MKVEYLLYAILGLGVGFSGGMLGIGGGVLLVPALVELFGVDQRRAAGITLCVLALPVAMPGAWQYLRQGFIRREDLLFAACIASTFAVGTFLGGLAQAKISISTLRFLFAFVLIAIAFRIIYKSDSEFHNAVIGITVAVSAWLLYLGLRTIGRRCAPPKSLAEHVREQATKPPDEGIEYYI